MLLSLYKMIIYTFGASVHSFNSASRLCARYETRQAKEAAAGADICDLDVKQKVTDRQDVCMFVPNPGRGNKVERRLDSKQEFTQ